MVGFTARAARLFPTTVIFIDGGPGAGFGFFIRNTFFLVAFFDVLGLTFLFVSVFRFISLRHGSRWLGGEKKNEKLMEVLRWPGRDVIAELARKLLPKSAKSKESTSIRDSG